MQSSRFNRDEETQAVWSIRQTSIPAYFIVSGLLFVLFNGLYVWRGLVNAIPGTATTDSVLAALREASGMVPWIVLSTILLVEGRYMLVEQYLKARYYKGVEKGMEVGMEVGAEKGEEKGRGEERQEWLAWYERMQAAQREGRPFDEPPPALLREQNGQ